MILTTIIELVDVSGCFHGVYKPSNITGGAHIFRTMARFGMVFSGRKTTVAPVWFFVFFEYDSWTDRPSCVARQLGKAAGRKRIHFSGSMGSMSCSKGTPESGSPEVGKLFPSGPLARGAQKKKLQKNIEKSWECHVFTTKKACLFGGYRIQSCQFSCLLCSSRCKIQAQASSSFRFRVVCITCSIELLNAVLTFSTWLQLTHHFSDFIRYPQWS